MKRKTTARKKRKPAARKKAIMTTFRLRSGAIMTAGNGWSVVQKGNMVYQVDPTGQVREDKVAFFGKVIK